MLVHIHLGNLSAFQLLNNNNNNHNNHHNNNNNLRSSTVCGFYIEDKSAMTSYCTRSGIDA